MPRTSLQRPALKGKRLPEPYPRGKDILTLAASPSSLPVSPKGENEYINRGEDIKEMYWESFRHGGRKVPRGKIFH